MLGLVYVGAYLSDEPLRRYVEHEVNGPFSVSDATMFQDAAPKPPIAHVGMLRTSVDWRALLEDRGWQRALEAVALDMKINRLRVVDGEVTYIDDGPFKPLRVSRIEATVENIRNIRSKERTYPSELHVSGTVFDTGELRLDGHGRAGGKG